MQDFDQAHQREDDGFDMFPHSIINQFFSGSRGIGDIFDQTFVETREEPPIHHSEAREGRHRARRQQNHPFGLFGFFDFPSIFNDDQFDHFGGMFQNSFNPGIFMNNFHSNFRSSRAFDDFLDMAMRMHQPPTNPAAKEVVEKLPVVVVEEKHCKKVEGKEELEPPCCPV